MALQHRFISNPRAFENFELFLNATGSDERLVLEWSYNTDLFDEATVRAWMEQLTSLDRTHRSRHRTPPSPTWSVMDPVAGEQELPPADWTGSGTAIPRGGPSVALFDEVAAPHGRRTAMEFVDRKRCPMRG